MERGVSLIRAVMVLAAMVAAWADGYMHNGSNKTNSRIVKSFFSILNDLRMGSSFLRNKQFHKYQIPYFCGKRKTPILRQKLSNFCMQEQKM